MHGAFLRADHWPFLQLEGQGWWMASVAYTDWQDCDGDAAAEEALLRGKLPPL